MTVVYYTHTYFLDATLETIQSFKKDVELHIIIELSPESKKSTLIDFENLEGLKTLEKAEDIIAKDKWQLLKKYFYGVASVSFAVYNSPSGFSPTNFKVAFAINQFIKKVKAEIVHFDTISIRSIGLYPFIRSKKIFITIHDPIPHAGEETWKKKIPEFVFFNLCKGFFFYSVYACKQFEKYHPKNKTNKNVLRFQPFTFIQNFIENSYAKANKHPILFFGRISVYKGIDLLLKAIPRVLRKYPGETFMIVGEPFSYKIDLGLVAPYEEQLIINETYLNIEELAVIIQNSKFVICPYREATQSGVLMTANALGKKAIATKVGAFTEYIDDNINGFLVEPNEEEIANKIIEVLDKNEYSSMTNVEFSKPAEATNQKNKNVFLNAYKN